MGDKDLYYYVKTLPDISFLLDISFLFSGSFFSHEGLFVLCPDLTVTHIALADL